MDRFHSTAAAARSAWSWRRSQACSAAAALVASGLCRPAPSSRSASWPTPPRYRNNWVGRGQRIDVTGVRPVRPGRDRARPVGPRAVSWLRSNGRGWTAGLKVLCVGGAAASGGLDTLVGTTHLATRQTVSDRHDGHAGGTKQEQPSVKRPQSTDGKPSPSGNTRSGRRESNPHSQLGRLGLCH